MTTDSTIRKECKKTEAMEGKKEQKKKIRRKII